MHCCVLQWSFSELRNEATDFRVLLLGANSNWSVTAIRGQTCSQSFICKYFRLQPLSSTDINIPQQNSQRWKDENTFTFQQNSSKPPCNYLLPINPAENWCMVETANPQLTSDEKLTIPMILLKTFARKPKKKIQKFSLLTIFCFKSLLH